jgi:hypothetical protein
MITSRSVRKEHGERKYPLQIGVPQICLYHKKKGAPREISISVMGHIAGIVKN